MTWNTLTIHHTSQCMKHCPFCYLNPAPGNDRPIEFFESILYQAGSIKEWIFSFNLLPPEKQDDLLKLVNVAWRSEHAYSITTNYENLYLIDPAVFQKSRSITLSLDEFKVPEEDLPEFYRALSWAKEKGMSTMVSMTLTEVMLTRLLHSYIFEKLLGLTDKLYFLVPKSGRYPFLHRDRFGDFLDFICKKIKNFHIYPKVEIDHCLLTILTPWKPLVNPECAYQKVLSLMPDGSLRICPYGAAFAILNQARDFERFIQREIDPYQLNELRYCQWRETWKVQEEAVSYAV